MGKKHWAAVVWSDQLGLLFEYEIPGVIKERSYREMSFSHCAGYLKKLHGEHHGEVQESQNVS